MTFLITAIHFFSSFIADHRSHVATITSIQKTLGLGKVFHPFFQILRKKYGEFRSRTVYSVNQIAEKNSKKNIGERVSFYPMLSSTINTRVVKGSLATVEGNQTNWSLAFKK